MVAKLLNNPSLVEYASEKLQETVQQALQDQKTTEALQTKLNDLVVGVAENPETVNSLSRLGVTLVSDSQLINATLSSLEQPEFKERTLKVMLWYMKNGETSREVKDAMIDLLTQREISDTVKSFLIEKLEDQDLFETVKMLILKLLNSPTLHAKLSDALYAGMIGSVTPRWLSGGRTEEMTADQRARVTEGVSEEATETVLERVSHDVVDELVDELD